MAEVSLLQMLVFFGGGGGLRLSAHSQLKMHPSHFVSQFTSKLVLGKTHQNAVFPEK